MSDQLSSVLTPEHLASFNEYQASVSGGMAGHHMESQLALHPFTEENFGIVRDTLVDVMYSGSFQPSEGMDTPAG